MRHDQRHIAPCQRDQFGHGARRITPPLEQRKGEITDLDAVIGGRGLEAGQAHGLAGAAIDAPIGTPACGPRYRGELLHHIAQYAHPFGAISKAVCDAGAELGRRLIDIRHRRGDDEQGRPGSERHDGVFRARGKGKSHVPY
jgi:hypothetical protein